jgi:hypothetical protein
MQSGIARKKNDHAIGVRQLRQHAATKPTPLKARPFRY